MAAGLGFKTFTTGEVLTAANVNGYLMQGINVFASTAARDAAITSPQEGQFAFTKDTNGLWYYDGAAWVASGATGDIEGVTAGIGISGGGTSGTVTVTNSMATAIDAKGDLVPGTGSDTFSRLAVGTNGTVLTADSAEATGMKWAAASGGASFSGVYCGGTSGQTVNATTQTILTWDLEVYDTDGYHSTTTNTGRITIPAGKAGYYLVHLCMNYAANSNTGHRTLYLVKNGSTFLNGGESTTGNSSVGGATFYSMIVNLAVGDYITAEAYLGATMNVGKDATYPASYFQAQYLGA
jgi:hypothetical protein